MSVRIGINPLSWTNDDMPELGAETPLEVCLKEGRDAGYAGFELGQKFPRDPNVLGPVLAEYGLTLVSGWYSLRLLERSVNEEIEAVQSHLALLKALGCGVMVVCEVGDCIHGQRDVPLSQRPVMAESNWETFCRRLGEVANYLQGQGIRMAYHHHMGTVIETEGEVDRLMASTTDAVGLLVDTGHLTYAGGDPVAVIARHGKRVVHVHCKDVRVQTLTEAKAVDSSFLNAVLAGVFTVPGDGCIDYFPVAHALKQEGYCGWLVVEAEQDPAKAHPLTYVTKGYQYLRKVVDATGL